ncbi:photosystem II cytochrome c-550 [Synechococcus sp. O70.2]|jgi:photosystem II cytochrome c550|uniref:photosystem II cytochrome c-550 n=1 Tax=Synechococcus sp. O70.2 TaxID=2964533 RepID=UPI0039C4BA28
MFSKSFSLQKALAAVRRRLLICILALGLAGFAGWPTLAARQIPPVPLSPTETITFTEAQLARGKQLFNKTCAQCHVGGQTLPNPDVTLKLADLAGATPPRDNVLAIVDYIKNPVTYDGVESLVEYHPNTQLLSEYPRLRNLTEEDLKLIAGYILVQAKTVPGWGGTKSESHSDLSAYL